jgi:FixJ family two-component response regulator
MVEGAERGRLWRPIFIRILKALPGSVSTAGCLVRSKEFIMTIRLLVSVVDDDESVRESLPDLLREFGFAVQAFSSAEEFLASDYLRQTSCLVLDMAMPGMTGPELQRELALRGWVIPIVFITASLDKAVRPSLLEQGAVECLFKPFSDTALLNALNEALRLN